MVELPQDYDYLMVDLDPQAICFHLRFETNREAKQVYFCYKKKASQYLLQ